MGWIDFLHGLVSDFHHTGAIAPSSRRLAESITRKVASYRGGRPPRVLEVGAGTGAFTEELLRILPEEATLHIYECNPRFIQTLHQKIVGVSPRVQLYADYIQNLQAEASYDFIVCGLPFNNFHPRDIREIFQLLFGHLREGGYLSFFEYLAIRPIKGVFCCEKETKRLKEVGKTFRAIRNGCVWEKELVFRNIPPAVVWHLQQKRQ